jgi:hypothetical protein
MPLTGRAAGNPPLAARGVGLAVLWRCDGCVEYRARSSVLALRRCRAASLRAICIPTTRRWPRIARTFLPELKDLLVQVLLLAPEAGVLTLGTISLDGTQMHADASRHNAVSSKRLLEVERQLRAAVKELFLLSEHSDQREVPDGLVVREEMARREDRLARLAEAKAVLEARASARAAAEQADYEAKLAQRAERERTTGRSRGGRPPTPPVPGPRDSDPDTVTDPASRILKNPTDAGYAQDYNAQIAVDQQSLFIVGPARSNHPTDSQEAEPTLAALPSEIGRPEAAARDAGYFGPVEPVLGIIKEVLGLRQFSLRGEQAAAGEWCLVCLACDRKRFQTLTWA